MAYLKYLTLCAFTLSLAMGLSAAPQPAAAQTAKKLNCNGCIKSRQLRNNGIKSKDLKPTISLGTSNNDGDFSVKDTAGTPTVSLDGDTGDVTNSLTGNGLVKAWARINANGTVAGCYRCNLDAQETRNVSTGVYEVDFTPLATDIQNRPRLCAPDGAGAAEDNSCATSGSGDTSTVVIRLYDIPNNSFGGAQGQVQNVPFTVVIF